MRRKRGRNASNRSGGEAGDEFGFLYDADPPTRQGLEALAKGRPRSFPAGGRTRVHRSLCRRTHHRPGREYHLLHCIPGLDRRRHQTDQARHRHHQYAEHPSRRRRRHHRDARPHARRTPDFRNQPRRTAVGCRIVRQSRRRPQRDVSGIDQPGAGNLGQRAAVQYPGKILEHLHGKDPDQGNRPGLHRRSRCSGRIRRSW